MKKLPVKRNWPKRKNLISGLGAKRTIKKKMKLLMKSNLSMRLLGMNLLWKLNLRMKKKSLRNLLKKRKNLASGLGVGKTIKKKTLKMKKQRKFLMRLNLLMRKFLLKNL